MATPQKLASYLASAEARRQGSGYEGAGADLYARPSSSPSKDYQNNRGSPNKYSGVKSKVAGNMKSIKKSQTRVMMQRSGNEFGPLNTDPSTRGLKASSPTKGRRHTAKLQAAPPSYHDQIIQEIKNKYSKDAINQMSHEELANEIL